VFCTEHPRNAFCFSVSCFYISFDYTFQVTVIFGHFITEYTCRWLKLDPNSSSELSRTRRYGGYVREELVGWVTNSLFLFDLYAEDGLVPVANGWNTSSTDATTVGNAKT
jgi:hypothetical protein